MFRSAGSSHISRKSVARTLLTLVLSVTFIVLVIAASFDQLADAQQQQQRVGFWHPEQYSARYSHLTYTRLHNGNVIAVGGGIVGVPGPKRSVEIFNPVTGLWRDTTWMNFERDFYNTLLLPDGKLLVIGGFGPAEYPGPRPYAGPPEIFDPATEKWSVINTTGVDLAAKYHNILLGAQPTAVALPSGKALLLGGGVAISPLLFDPNTGVVEARSQSPTLKKFFNTLTALIAALFDGRVLVKSDQDALIYDPDNDTWTHTNTPKVNDVDLTGNINTILPDGSLLALQSAPGGSQAPSLFSAVFDPAKQQWGNYVKLDKFAEHVIALTNGDALSISPADNRSELYDPESKTWNPTNPLGGPAFSPVLLADGRVLSGTQAFGDIFGTSANPVAVNTSAASFRVEPLARGSIASVFGRNLSGANLRIRDSADVNHSLTRVFSDTPGQVNYLVPETLQEGQAAMTTADGTPLARLSVSRVSPGLFTADASGHGLPAAVALRVTADGAQVYESIANGIDLGASGESVFLILFGTGMSKRTSLDHSLVYIGGVKTKALYVGKQGDFDGLEQVNVQIPESLAGKGKVDLLLTVDRKTANVVNLKIN